MPLSPAVNGTEQRLDLLLDAIQQLRGEVRALKPSEPPEPVKPERETETVQLRELSVTNTMERSEPLVMEPPPKPKPKPKRRR